MKVTLEVQDLAKKTEHTEQISHQKETYHVNQATFSVYRKGEHQTIMGNYAYHNGAKKTTDLLQKAKTADAKIQKDYMVVMSNTVSKEDLAKMYQDGFDPRKTDIKTYVSIVDQIKVTLAKAGVKIEGYNDHLDADLVKEITNSELDVNALCRQFEQSDLPVTEDNVQALIQAVKEAGQITGLSEDALKYMIVNQKLPTIENLYLAQYSSAHDLKQAKGYYAEEIKGYYAQKAQSDQIDQVEEQIRQFVEGLGFLDQKDKLEQAKWLVESGLELSKENLDQLSVLSELKLPKSKEELVTLGVTAMENGKAPDQALLTGEYSYQNLEALENRLQTEEMRALMSAQANKYLLKQGIEVDITPIQEVIDALKQIKEDMLSVLYQGDSFAENVSREQLYEKSVQTTKELQQLPCFSIGKFLRQGEICSVSRLHTEEILLQQKLNQAQRSYEALATAPSVELGDSLTKAFRHIEDLLSELGIAVTDENKKAVRILAYNHLEITAEHLHAVKNANQQVTRVLDKLTPKATLDLIRANINPLELSLEELEQKLDQNEQEQGSHLDQFAKYLQKLTHANGITEDERKAYMGMYRMFRQIEKSDGAVIGHLVATKAQITFKNMLSAVRTRATHGIDQRIDEEFGCLERFMQTGEKIDTQIQAGFSSYDQEKDYGRMASEITKALAEDTSVEQLQKVVVTEETTMEAFRDELLSLEKTQPRITRAQEEAFRELLAAAQRIENGVIDELISYDQTISLEQLEAAKSLMLERGALFQKINGMKQEAKVMETNKNAEEIIEQFTDKEHAQAAYENMIQDSFFVLENRLDEPGLTELDLKTMQATWKELSLVRKLAQKENYEIPVEIKGEWTSINLKIFHEQDKKGNVSVSMDTKAFGQVVADFVVSANRISGLIACEHENDSLSKVMWKDRFQEALQDDQKEIAISFAKVDTLDLLQFGKKSKTAEATEVSNKELYQTAKAFLEILTTLF